MFPLYLAGAKLAHMKAMLLHACCDLSENPAPLGFCEVPCPEPNAGEILLKVAACGVCHTELDEIEGRTPPPSFPVIPGHQVIGHVVARGGGACTFDEGRRVGVAWIYSACGRCEYCRKGQENLCPSFLATGRDANGGYAEYMTVPEGFAFSIPDRLPDLEAAPLLCAGAIGFRSLRLTGLCDGQRLGLTGFGASAHLVLGMVKHRFPDSAVFVFARSEKERSFARELGAAWAGDTAELAPEPLHAMIDTTPAWKPVLHGLKSLAPGGRMVINAIRKEERDRDEWLQLDYANHLWMEKEIKSVANVTRADVREFLELAAEIPLCPEIEIYPLLDANRALVELKQGHVRGAKVLQI